MEQISAFDASFNYVAGAEGVLSLDPRDSGNWTGGAQGQGLLKGTKYGISAAAYPNLDIVHLTLDEAKDIYQTDYWVPARCPLYKPFVALMVFDAAVNQGIARAIKMLQETLGVHVDGQMGPGTLGALGLASPYPLVQEYRDTRLQHYQRDTGWPTYGKGWTKRINATAAAAAALI